LRHSKSCFLGSCSGQEVLDPRDFMKRARAEMGAETGDEYRANQPSGHVAFTGAGQSLNGEATTSGEQAPQRPQEHTITFWQNGFSVDDGPLRDAQDPANAAFLADVHRGIHAASQSCLGPHVSGVYWLHAQAVYQQSSQGQMAI